MCAPAGCNPQASAASYSWAGISVEAAPATCRGYLSHRHLHDILFPLQGQLPPMVLLDQPQHRIFHAQTATKAAARA